MLVCLCVCVFACSVRVVCMLRACVFVCVCLCVFGCVACDCVVVCGVVRVVWFGLVLLLLFVFVCVAVRACDCVFCVVLCCDASAVLYILLCVGV